MSKLDDSPDGSLDARLEDSIRIVRQWIDQAERVTVLTGAGISTDSGIPDFRGPQGLWTKNPEAEKMATIQNYMADPEVRKRAWKSRMDSFPRRAEPNVGHHSLVELERRGKLHLLITQNVDGLHHDAGNSAERIVEIHGTMREIVCMACGDRHPMQYAVDRVNAGEEDPPCEKCGGILKSATISFGQGLVSADLERAEAAAHGCDLMFAIGTTLGVYPIAAVVPIAKQSGARVVILNADPTEMDHLADAVLRGGIADILPLVVSEH
jgi:NAD-dependent deacetylase